jgi:hypothetical protein
MSSTSLLRSVSAKPDTRRTPCGHIRRIAASPHRWFAVSAKTPGQLFERVGGAGLAAGGEFAARSRPGRERMSLARSCSVTPPLARAAGVVAAASQPRAAVGAPACAPSANAGAAAAPVLSPWRR